MKFLKNGVNEIFLCFFEAIVGILLLINPVEFTSGIITTVGVVSLFLGFVEIMKYFRTEREEAAIGQYLLKGLGILLVGAFCAFNAKWFIDTFPALSVVYGVLLMFTGLSKIQLAFDMIRKKNQKWTITIASAGVSVLCAALILKNLFASNGLWIFTGISLIVVAGIDLAAIIIRSRNNKEEKETAAKE